MANLLNATSCLTGSGNTGVAACTLDLKNVIGCLLVPTGTVIPASAMVSQASFLAYLKQQTYASRSLRFFPVHDFEEFTDSSEANTYDTLGYGGKYKTKNGWMGWAWQIVTGGMCLYLQLFNLLRYQGQYDVLYVDSSYTVFGKNVGTGLAGIPTPLIDPMALKLATGSKITNYSIYFSFPQDFLYSFGFFMMNPGDFDSVVGLQTAVLSEVVARASNVVTIGAVLSCGARVNLYDTYSTNLNQVTAWVVTDSVTGLVQTISSVALVAGSKGWAITVATTAPPYAAGNPLVVTLAAPAVLQAAPISLPGIEGNTITTAS